MADETKYKKRPTRKVVRSLRMPASARGGYEVPEEATWEDEEEIAPHMEIDPMTGEEYTPRGIEEAAGPEDIADPAQVKSALRKGPLVLGMLKRMKMPKINPKAIPVESTVRTPLAVIDKEFAKKAMTPAEEGMRRGYGELLEAAEYPVEKRAGALKEQLENVDEKLEGASGAMMGQYLPIEDSLATKSVSSRAYVLDPKIGVGKIAQHEGTHKLLRPVGSIKSANRTAYERILNKEIPDNVKDGIDALLMRRGYNPEDRHAEYIPWLTNFINKQTSVESVPNIRKLTKGEYLAVQRDMREVNQFKKDLMREFNWEEKDYNQFMKDAKKAYNAVATKAENLAPEEIAAVEKQMLEGAARKIKKAAPSSEVAAMKELTPDVDEEIGVTLEKMRRVNPELGKEKDRSVLQKIADPFLEFLEDRKNKKWSEQYSKDRRAYIQQQLEDRKRKRFMQAEQKRKTIEEAGTPIEGGTKPPTEIE